LPRSGRLLGLSLQKNSVTDFERFFLLMGSRGAGGLSTRRVGESLVSLGLRCCRRGDTELVSSRALLTGSGAMLPSYFGFFSRRVRRRRMCCWTWRNQRPVEQRKKCCLAR
jgi:hypothetical protein